MDKSLWKLQSFVLTDAVSSGMWLDALNISYSSNHVRPAVLK